MNLLRLMLCLSATADLSREVTTASEKAVYPEPDGHFEQKLSEMTVAAEGEGDAVQRLAAELAGTQWACNSSAALHTK